MELHIYHDTSTKQVLLFTEKVDRYSGTWEYVGVTYINLQTVFQSNSSG